MSKYILKRFSPPGRQTILVSAIKRYGNIPTETRDPLTGANIAIFDQLFGFGNSIAADADDETPRISESCL